MTDTLPTTSCSDSNSDNSDDTNKINHETKHDIKAIFNLKKIPDNINLLMDDLKGCHREDKMIEKHRDLMLTLPEDFRHVLLYFTLPNFSEFNYHIPRLHCLSLMLHGTEDYRSIIEQSNHHDNSLTISKCLGQHELDLRFSLLNHLFSITQFKTFNQQYYSDLIALIVYNITPEQLNSSNRILKESYILPTLLLNSQLHPFIAILQKFGLDVYHINHDNSLLWFLDSYYKRKADLQDAIEYLVNLDIALVEENSRFYTFFDYIVASWIFSFMGFEEVLKVICNHDFFDLTRKQYHHKNKVNENSPWPSRIVAGENVLFNVRFLYYYNIDKFDELRKKLGENIKAELNNTELNPTLINYEMKHVFNYTMENPALWYLLEQVDTGSNFEGNNPAHLDSTFQAIVAKDIANKISFYNRFFIFFKDFSDYCYHTFTQREFGPVKNLRELNYFESAFYYYLQKEELLAFKNEFLKEYKTRFITTPVVEVIEDSKKDDEIHGVLFSEEKQKNFETYVTNVGSGNGSSFENSKAFVKRLATEKNIREKTLAKSAALLAKIEQLYHDFPHFNEVIEHIENHCVLQNSGNGAFYVPPLLLAGGPGIGKTFFCHTISELVDTPMHVFNMESMTGNFAMTGLSESWGNAAPGMIFNVLANKHRLNPIFIFDELDKARGDERFSPTNSLLPLLERYTAANFKDECIQIELDASHSIWVATANTLETLSAPLKSRFDIYNVPNPNWHQRRNLIQGIYHSLLKNHSWGDSLESNLSETVLDVLADAMGPGAARDLRRSITTACAKAVRHQRKEITLADLPVFQQQVKMPWDTSVNFQDNRTTEKN